MRRIWGRQLQCAASSSSMSSSGLRRRRIAVAMSGGVDSTVSALLLQQHRHLDLVGVFMKNWDERDETHFCEADKEAERVKQLCRRMQIPFRQVNLVKEYWNEVFEPLVHDYQLGLTPNPDILCNRQVKFHHFHRHCLDTLNCDAVATGHYATKAPSSLSTSSSSTVVHRLLQSADPVKDQTFFLSQISQSSLARALFPVGHLTKAQVKALAVEHGYADVARKKESMGICFVGKRRCGFQDFLEQYVPSRSGVGRIVDIDSGLVLGEHDGVHQWTPGQKLLLQGSVHKYYVVSRDAPSQTLTVCQDECHPALYCEEVRTGPAHWIAERPKQLDDGPISCLYRFQNTHPLKSCSVTLLPDGQGLVIRTLEPMRAATPGQFMVLYRDKECLGSAVIESPGPSLHEQCILTPIINTRIA